MDYKIALITGASSGIGEAFAKALAARGMDLILVARSEDRLRSLAKQLAEVHSRRMTHAFLPAMLERGRGGIVNIASMAAFQPLPFFTTYAATKAFVLSFTQGIRGEVRRKGIKVLCVCPGPVDTPFFEATGNDKLRSSVPRATFMTAEAVVRGSLKALAAGRSVFVPGMANRLVAAGTHFVPRDVLAAMTAMVMKR